MTNLYICTDASEGNSGSCAIANTPEQAFEDYCDYFDENAKLCSVNIYKLGPKLTGTISYNFTEVGT